MVLDEIISLLRNDSKLTNLFGSKKIYAKPCTDLGECIVYDFTSVSADKITATNRLEIHIVTNTIEKGLQAEQAVKDVLLTFGDEKLSQLIRDVYLNGGGSLYDEERKKHHKILYFYIKSKEC